MERGKIVPAAYYIRQIIQEVGKFLADMSETHLTVRKFTKRNTQDSKWIYQWNVYLCMTAAITTSMLHVLQHARRNEVDYVTFIHKVLTTAVIMDEI